MSRLFLVRHGETIWHAENRYAGSTDIALTAKGRQQADSVGRWAATAELTALWSSPMLRARDTIAPAVAATGLPLRLDERLRELCFGQGEGLTGKEMEARFPAQRAAFLRDPVAAFLPGGEDPVLAAQRGALALVEIAASSVNGRSLVVAHSTLFRLVLCHLMGLPLANYRDRFPHLANGAVSEVEWTTRGLSLLSLNVPIG